MVDVSKDFMVVEATGDSVKIDWIYRTSQRIRNYGNSENRFIGNQKRMRIPEIKSINKNKINKKQ